MRLVEFVQHLLQQQMKLPIARDPCDQRFVAFANAGPVHAAKLRIVKRSFTVCQTIWNASCRLAGSD